MDRRQLGIAFALGLATLTVFLGWFDYSAATAIFHPTTDSVGHARYQVPGYSNTVYPFTYAAVAVSVLGTAALVFLQERRSVGRFRAGVLGLLIGNLASIGMIDCYEQVYIYLAYLTPTSQSGAAAWLAFYWGTAGGLAATVGGMLVVLAILPWSRRQNWPGVALCLGIFGAAMSAWFLHGYASPESGDSWDYSMNALSRVASQLALVAAVLPTDFVATVRRSVKTGVRKYVANRPTPGRPRPDPELEVSPD